jgi:peptidoglycan DL-endopeptidase LytE
MKIFKFFLILIATFSYSQQYIKHKVVQGESVYNIAKKYQVPEKEIFEKNPKAKGVLALNTVLLIPNKNYKKAEPKIKKQSEQVVDKLPITHTVLPKETLFGISKKYKISITDLENLNPNLKTKGLQVGMVLQLIHLSSTQISEKTAENLVTESYIIQPKDTKYKIAKKFNLSISQLESFNPNLPKDFPIGYQLNLKPNSETKIIEEPKPEVKITDKIEKPEIKTPSENSNLTEKINLVIEKASENIGVKYKNGGTNKSGFDCSGLMLTSFESINIKLPRTSAEQANFGTNINLENAQKGDLIFFKTNGSSNINHVGLVTEVTASEIKFIHASSSAGVIISTLSEEYYSNKFEKINRVVD